MLTVAPPASISSADGTSRVLLSLSLAIAGAKVCGWYVMCRIMKVGTVGALHRKRWTGIKAGDRVFLIIVIKAGHDDPVGVTSHNSYFTMTNGPQ
jgi:hypothetical protein